MDIQNLSAFYREHQIEFNQLEINEESNAYSACSFSLDSKKVVFRKANSTPKKTGQFVAIWKRSEGGETTPYEEKDNLDFLIIAVETDSNSGHFIFSKQILVEKGIISSEKKSGKRGIRVYPCWDVVTSKQAMKTQEWQLNYFIDFKNIEQRSTNSLKKLLAL